MSFKPFPGRERLLIAGMLDVLAALAGVIAWRHAATTGAPPFVCGPSAGHCLACYAAPLLAAAGLAILAAPRRSVGTI